MEGKKVLWVIFSVTLVLAVVLGAGLFLLRPKQPKAAETAGRETPSVQGFDAYEYVRGNVHTNSLENFWSLLKRGLRGTYVSVEPFHLFRYLDEQSYRYNYRKDMNDSDRFSLALSQIAGKRLSYDLLTGKQPDPNNPTPTTHN